eukprot:gene5906-2311_t
MGGWYSKLRGMNMYSVRLRLLLDSPADGPTNAPLLPGTPTDARTGIPTGSPSGKADATLARLLRIRVPTEAPTRNTHRCVHVGATVAPTK